VPEVLLERQVEMENHAVHKGEKREMVDFTEVALAAEAHILVVAME
jgi:hypothetical protein